MARIPEAPGTGTRYIAGAARPSAQAQAQASQAPARSSAAASSSRPVSQEAPSLDSFREPGAEPTPLDELLTGLFAISGYSGKVSRMFFGGFGGDFPVVFA